MAGVIIRCVKGDEAGERKNQGESRQTLPIVIEEERQESNQQLTTLINAIPDFIYFKDGEGRWFVANDLSLRLFRIEGVPGCTKLT